MLFQCGRLKTMIFTMVVLSSISFLRETALAGESWPTKPISLVVGWAAGGGTDIANRFLAAEMGTVLGQPIAVTNMVGGMAGIAAAHVMSLPADGYTWWGTGEQFYAQAVMGGHASTVKDWHLFLAFGAQDLLSVKSDSAYKTFEEFAAAMKKTPGKIKLAASGVATHMHIAAVAINKVGKLDFELVPYNGSNPSQLALLRGEVDAVITTVQEQMDFIKTGKFRPLVAVDNRPVVFEGKEIVAMTKFIPALQQYLPVPQALGFGLPKNTPREIVGRVDQAFKQVMASGAAKEFAKKLQLPILGDAGWSPDKAIEMAWNPTRVGSWAYYEAGLAKVSPEKFGIPRP